jgi:RNA polymerase sigma-70 factor (ECF subfamily)
MGAQPGSQHREPSDPNVWLDEHGDALFRYALLHLGDQTAAEDAVQETFLAALKARGGFSGQSSERTWLIGILKHKVVDHIRGRVRDAANTDLESTAEFVNACFSEKGLWKSGPAKWGRVADEPFEKSEFWEVYRFCVSRLPALMSGAFLMRETSDISTDEICKVLNVTATNLWTMLHRARTRLRACLETNWFGRES